MCINADESEPATFNNRLLMEKDPHQLLEGILIACFATKATTAYLYLRFEYIRAYRILEAAIEEARAAGHLGKNIYGTGLQSRRLAAPRRRGLHLRRGDRADRKPRREAGLAADQAAVPGHRRCVSQADGRQQRRDALLRSPHRRARAELVQIDRHAQELRPQALLRLGSREQAGLRRASAGSHLPRLDRRARRRRLERAEKPRRPCRAASAWACFPRASWTRRSTSRACASRAAWGWGRPPSRSSTTRPASSTTSTTPAGSSPTRAAASARPAARGPAGSTRP